MVKFGEGLNKNRIFLVLLCFEDYFILRFSPESMFKAVHILKKNKGWNYLISTFCEKEGVSAGKSCKMSGFLSLNVLVQMSRKLSRHRKEATPIFFSSSFDSFQHERLVPSLV